MPKTTPQQAPASRVSRTSRTSRAAPTSSAQAAKPARWLLLIHQLPPQPSYLRVKIWRRIQRLGAVAIKNSVYVMPHGEQAHEDLQWVLREIVEGGGDGTVCEARLLDGLSDSQVEALFHAARDADYALLLEAGRALFRALRSAQAKPAARAPLEAELVRLRRQLAEIVRLDFFAAPGRRPAEALLHEIEASLRTEPEVQRSANRGKLRGRTWVTRKDVHVDRIASAWLIQRFIDPKARFKFVGERRYRPAKNELRFDMFDAEYTHEGDRCTFEVLVARFELEDPGLRALAEIVHDIDLKDGKFGRPETPGIDQLLTGVTLAHADDTERLARGVSLLDDLHAFLRQQGT